MTRVVQSNKEKKDLIMRCYQEFQSFSCTISLYDIFFPDKYVLQVITENSFQL